MEVVFKCSAGEIGVEVEGPEEFVRWHLEFLIPWVRRATGAPGPVEAAGSPAAGPAGIEGVAVWWRRTVPAGVNPSLQDTILLFAYYMRTYRKTVFLSEDARRCFQVMGMEEPKSLLQILGTLKREHGMLLAAGKRGEYMMSIPGINRAREILGVRTSSAAPPSPAFAAAAASYAGEATAAGPSADDGPPAPAEAPKAVDARSIFKD